ncbi:hypothetical protein LX36DRAFT_733734 [Colletotrichum falcatum]|nr:hypothetical protein LX36DRAFT_733734 [Colletotrichum falcatum]
MEEEVSSHSRQLRQSTLSHRPGRYEESQAYGEGCQAPTADNENGCQIVTYNMAERDPPQGESFKDFLLATTNDLDWGSPEPEEIEEPIEWCQVTLSGQWALLSALCQYKAFASATHLLKMKITDIIDFVGLYIHCHRETKLWVNEIIEAPVEVLLETARGVEANADMKITLKRPYLPTDMFWDDERKQAINYLHQVGQTGFVEDVGKWRGCSTTFHTLPIEPEIMAACTVILDKGMGSLEVKKIKLPQTKHTKQSPPWPGRVQSECPDLAECMAELQAYLHPLTTNPSEPMPSGNLKDSKGPRNPQNTKENSFGSSHKQSKRLWSNAKHDAQLGQGPAVGFNCGQNSIQDGLSVAENSRVSGVYSFPSLF